MTQTRIAILGSGGREHALAWKFAQHLPPSHIWVLPGNGGMANTAPLDLNDFDAIGQFCIQQGIGLIFVGPEVPLANGIVDYFRQHYPTIAIFGPTQAAAQLEASKIWAKQFMQRNHVATASFWTFTHNKDALPLLTQLNGRAVIKFDGLAAGKGVFVCGNMTEACAALAELNAEYGSNIPFLVEERLDGYEVSLIGFTDGYTFKALHPAQDHKQLLDGDKGPNTGGMGVYCPFVLTEQQYADIEQHIVQPTLRGIVAEQLDYKGIIYFGIMMTAQGAQLLEYNARFGDPETEVLLPALETELLPIVEACLAGRLAQCEVVLRQGFWIDVVLASGGYPKQYAKGLPIYGIEQLAPDTLLFHAGTAQIEDGKLITAGGRVLNVVGHGHTLAEAIAKTYAEVQKISFDGMQYRRDIGQRKGE